MALTFEAVRQALAPDEPNYEHVKELGAEALPHLTKMIESQDPHLAPKATWAAGLVGGVGTVNIAATTANSAVRAVAAAATQHFLPQQASSILEKLVDDKDDGVRKMALRHTPKGASRELLSKVEHIAKVTDDEYLRGLAREALELNR